MKSHNTLIRNPERKIKYRKFSKDGYEHYHIGVWIDGTDEELSEVSRVEYLLHSSFKNRSRSSRARENGFSVTFWAWGTFDIQDKLHKRNGEIETKVHSLKFNLPVDDGTNYVDVSAL